ADRARGDRRALLGPLAPTADRRGDRHGRAGQRLVVRSPRPRSAGTVGHMGGGARRLQARRRHGMVRQPRWARRDRARRPRRDHHAGVDPRHRHPGGATRWPARITRAVDRAAAGAVGGMTVASPPWPGLRTRVDVFGPACDTWLPSLVEDRDGGLLQLAIPNPPGTIVPVVA